MLNKKTVFLWFFIIILLGTAFFYGYWDKTRALRSLEQENSSGRAVQEERLADLALQPDERALGNPDTARVIVVEYSDTECPWCKSFHYKYKEQIHAVSSSDVALV